MHNQILAQYGNHLSNSQIQLFGDGLINKTWKIKTVAGNYILQQVNASVFKTPEDIDENLNKLRLYLEKNNPEYLFISPLPTLIGESLVHTEEGYFRLFPFVENSHSLNVLTQPEEAFEGAAQFGKFSRVLQDFDVSRLKITLPDFHNLSLRYQQFNTALENASAERKARSSNLISFIQDHRDIVDTYEKIVSENLIPVRVVHHDTKINNVLLNQQNKGMCVIDLDTVMPGYFISDVGDMMRTYLSSANEEETDLSQINVRKAFFKAIYAGYMSEMGNVLTAEEQEYFIYSGKFLIYMQAIRFLTDYLSEDVYYGSRYPGHNLNRAANQIRLLECYLKMEDELNAMVATAGY